MKSKRYDEESETPLSGVSESPCPGGEGGASNSFLKKVAEVSSSAAFWSLVRETIKKGEVPEGLALVDEELDGIYLGEIDGENLVAVGVYSDSPLADIASACGVKVIEKRIDPDEKRKRVDALIEECRSIYQELERVGRDSLLGLKLKEFYLIKEKELREAVFAYHGDGKWGRARLAEALNEIKTGGVSNG